MFTATHRISGTTETNGTETIEVHKIIERKRQIETEQDFATNENGSVKVNGYYAEWSLSTGFTGCDQDLGDDRWAALEAAAKEAWK